MPDAARPCPVCASADTRTLYRSGTARSLSSLCIAMEGEKVVRGCDACGHLFADPLADGSAYYGEDYRILLESEDEDQIYEERDSRTITRSEHQMAVLDHLGAPARGMPVLDFGAAKGAMARLMAQNGADVHVFDVGSHYVPFWNRFLRRDRQALQSLPGEWQSRFSLVTSFFAFEHIDDPADAARTVAGLLMDGGRFHCVVPDVFGNKADFIVADHVNHFTVPSLTRLLEKAGFGAITVSPDLHRGALVASAVKGGKKSSPMPNTAIREAMSGALELAAYWKMAGDAIREAEANSGGIAALYGSGFYGAFIMSQLAAPARVASVLDRSIWRQGQKLEGIEITAPETLRDDTAVLYVGLNPVIARGVIEGQPQLSKPGRQIVFLP